MADLMKRRRYHIGCDDGENRGLSLDAIGIRVLHEGWDSKMSKYLFVFDHKGHRCMPHNSNRYDKTGLGLAALAYG
jgi:hypothetical protein